MLAASGADVKVQLIAHGWRSRHTQATIEAVMAKDLAAAKVMGPDIS